MEFFYEGLYDELSPYVRALAWWHAVPQPPLGQNKQPAVRNRDSRMKMRIDAGGEPDMPFLDPVLTSFVTILFEAGPTSAGGQSAIPLTWADLQAWQAGIGVSLPPWQARLIRRLSGDYLSESHQAEADDAPPPWDRELTSARRAKVAGHIRNVMRG